MERRVVLLLCLSIWGVTGKVDHAELRGEQPRQEDIVLRGMRCDKGYPSGTCVSECHAINTAPTCSRGECMCLTLFQPAAIGPSLTMTALDNEVEERARKQAAIHNWAMGGVLIYLCVVCILLYTRHGGYRLKHASVC